MKRTCTILFAAIVSLLSTGCQVFIYQPQAVDIPLINHQGDTRVDAAVGLSTFLLPNRLTLNATGTSGAYGICAIVGDIDDATVEQILAQGESYANEVANRKLHQVQRIVGLRKA